MESESQGVFFKYANVQSVILFVLVLSLYSLLFRKRKDETNFPPGPKGWPFLGNIPSVSFHFEREMYEWNKKYGPVCRLKMASLDFVILGNVQAVEEAFVKKSDSFSNRMQNSVAGLSGDKGMLFVNYGHKLKEQRRFGLATLREFGMGRKSIEPSILETCSELCDRIENQCSKNESFSIDFMVYETVSWVISQLVFNKNLPAENEGFREFLHLVVTGSKYSIINGVAAISPVLKNFPPWSWGVKEADRYENGLNKLFQEEIDDHKRTRDPKDPRDFIDCFLNEMDSAKKSAEGADAQGFNDEQLIGLARDLFLAGSETTSTTICWAILYLTQNPEMQDKLYEEISDVVGQARQPTTALSDEMPYTKAVIQETLRIRPVAPIGVPHLASREDTIMGYRIPKGTLVVSNLFRIQNDETIWENPEKFDPQRHIGSDGKFVKNPTLITFSIGARQCLGPQLANMELFLITVSLFQRYSFTLADECQGIDMRGKNIFTLRPYPFKVFAHKR